jgi:peptidoglycan hydrolase-like protein with peptidoglycan-binding domain
VGLGWIDDTDEPVIRDLSRGDHGLDVEVLQRLLVKRGYALLEAQVDGVFGRSTEACVVHFQWRHGLNMDGVAGPRTRVALGLTARPPEHEGEEPALSEIEGLELGLGPPLTDHADMVSPDYSDSPD